MYPKTQQCIAEQRRAGVYPGVAYQLTTSTAKETQIIGAAALEPTYELLTAAHVFDVASLTKVICTTSVCLRLWEHRAIDFDEPLRRYLPQVTNQRLTLRHLLTHTADIQTWIANRDQLSAAALRQAYYAVQSGDKLGQEVRYTDIGTLLLGFMFEEIFQQSVADIFQQEVLTPLAMTNSYFSEVPFNQAIVSTEKLADGSILRGQTHDPKARKLGVHAGNAGLFTTLGDIEKFSEMYLNWGATPNAPFLKEATVAMLLNDQTPNGQGFRSFGWDLKGPKDAPMLFHTGYTGTFLIIDPQQQQTFSFLSNRIHPQDLRTEYLTAREVLLANYFAEKMV